MMRSKNHEKRAEDIHRAIKAVKPDMGQAVFSPKKQMFLGMVLTLMGGILWGFSGTCVQFIDSVRHVNLEWLVTVRLFVAGLVTLLWALFKSPKQLVAIMTHKGDLKKLVVFSIFGVSMCQYAYFQAIAAAGVGVATVIQYVGPSLIILYLLIRYRAIPRRGEILSVFLAFIGTVCIVFHNGLSLDGLNLSVVCWGLLSATGIAVYSIQPIEILKKYGTSVVMGLSMVLGSVVAFILFQPSSPGGDWDLWTYLAVFGGVIGLGTIVSFNAYMEGIKRIGSVQGSILSSIEPISAAILGCLLLGNRFTFLDMVGFILILSTVFILALQKK